MNYRFHFLWIGQSIANLGDVLYIVAVMSYIYQTTGSTTMAALYPVTRLGALLISGLLAPLLIDRFRLHPLLLAAQSAQAVLLALMTGYALFFSATGTIWPLLLLVFAISFCDGWTTPARNALVARLVSPHQLLRANSMMAVADQVVMLLGWASGGFLVAYLGHAQTLQITLLLFLLSVLSLSMTRDRAAQPEVRGATPISRREAMQEGWRTLWQGPFLRTLTLMDLLESLANAVWSGAIMLVFAREALNRGEDWWGYLNTSYSVGTITGGLLVGALARRLQGHLVFSLSFSSLTVGLLTLLFAYTDLPYLALFLCALMGPPYQLREIIGRTILQRSVASALLPKVFAAQGTLLHASFSLSVLLLGGVTDHFGIRVTYTLSALLFGFSGLLPLISRRVVQTSSTLDPPA